MKTLSDFDMIEVSVDRLLELGDELAASGERWHNHVLSTDCRLNDRPQCALVVEASDRGEVYVVYSDEPMMEVGRRLATLVHGVDPLASRHRPADRSTNPSTDEDLELEICSLNVIAMMRRAAELSAHDRHWHHHIVFPECVFNPHPGSWTILFEDPQTGETLESVSAERPADDIRVTETLFFSQRTQS